jgi:hypothetical protein
MMPQRGPAHRGTRSRAWYYLCPLGALWRGLRADAADRGADPPQRDSPSATSFFRRAFSAPNCLRQLSCGQLIEQRLSLFQIERIEAFGEPAVDWREKITRLIPLALIAPEPRHAYRCPEFKALRFLLLRNGQSPAEGSLRRSLVDRLTLEQNFPFDALRFRFTNAPLSVPRRSGDH